MRQRAAPPDPDSWGSVRAILFTRAPTMKAPLPFRLQPVAQPLGVDARVG